MYGFRGTENIIIIELIIFKNQSIQKSKDSRFDKLFMLHYPDIGRTNIFKHYLKKQNMVILILKIESILLIWSYITLVSLLTKGSTPLHKVTFLSFVFAKVFVFQRSRRMIGYIFMKFQLIIFYRLIEEINIWFLQYSISSLIKIMNNILLHISQTDYLMSLLNISIDTFYPIQLYFFLHLHLSFQIKILFRNVELLFIYFCLITSSDNTTFTFFIHLLQFQKLLQYNFRNLLSIFFTSPALSVSYSILPISTKKFQFSSLRNYFFISVICQFDFKKANFLYFKQQTQVTINHVDLHNIICIKQISFLLSHYVSNCK